MQNKALQNTKYWEILSFPYRLSDNISRSSTLKTRSYGRVLKAPTRFTVGGPREVEIVRSLTQLFPQSICVPIVNGNDIVSFPSYPILHSIIRYALFH